MMIGLLGWEEINLIRARKHLDTRQLFNNFKSILQKYAGSY